MSGKQERLRRQQQLDPRNVQIVLLGALEWDGMGPGTCRQCGAPSSVRRSRWRQFDSGQRSHLPMVAGEPDAVYVDRQYRTMSANQREGDFSLAGPPISLCRACAEALLRAGILALDENDTLFRVALRLSRAYLTVGAHPWTAVAVVAAPGPAGAWRVVCTTAATPLDPDTICRALRREVKEAVPASRFVRSLRAGDRHE
jgi:hypothetical protein